MSDSYTAYCERMERNACMFSDENVNSIKHTKVFDKTLANAKAAHKTAKLCKAKLCENCKNNHYINGMNVCVKLGMAILDCSLVCEHWKGRLRRFNLLKPDEKVVAWSIIDKKADVNQ